MTSRDLLHGLLGRLEIDRPTLQRLAARYDGTAPHPAAATTVRRTPARANISRPVVDRIAERLTVVGFRPGAGAAPDPSLWDLWQGSGLDRASRIAHREALVSGRVYAMAWSKRGKPCITVESARSCYVAHDPATGERVAAVKVWSERPPAETLDAVGTLRAVVFTDDTVTRWKGHGTDPQAAGWERTGTEPNALGVPLVRLAVGAGLLTPDGESVLTDVEPLADAVDELVDGMLVASTFYADPRRYILGELPTDETGEIDTEGAVDRTAGREWWLEGVTQVGQLPPADLTAYTRAIPQVLRLLAATTGLPEHAVGLNPDANPSSADAIRAAEASLACRARDMQATLAEGWEEVMRLALTVRDGVAPVNLDGLETVWADPETRTVAAQVDATAKLVSVGIPVEIALANTLGWTPAQLDQLRAARRAEALESAGADLLRSLRS
jgi:hypothetical protein